MRRKRKPDSSLLIKLQRLSVRNATAAMAGEQLPNLVGAIRLFKVEGQIRVPLDGEFRLEVARHSLYFRRQDIDMGFSVFRFPVSQGAAVEVRQEFPNAHELKLTTADGRIIIARFESNSDMTSFRDFFNGFLASLPLPDPENVSPAPSSESETTDTDSSVADGSNTSSNRENGNGTGTSGSDT